MEPTPERTRVAVVIPLTTRGIPGGVQENVKRGPKTTPSPNGPAHHREMLISMGLVQKKEGVDALNPRPEGKVLWASDDRRRDSISTDC